MLQTLQVLLKYHWLYKVQIELFCKWSLLCPTAVPEDHIGDLFILIFFLLFWLSLFVLYMRDFTCWILLDTHGSRKAHLWTNKTIFYAQKDGIKKNISLIQVIFFSSARNLYLGILFASLCKFRLRGMLLAQRSSRVSLDFCQANLNFAKVFTCKWNCGLFSAPWIQVKAHHQRSWWTTVCWHSLKEHKKMASPLKHIKP